MARIRTIKPTHWEDDELPKISLQAHLLWIGTWNFSDDDGVFQADPLWIKSKIFPRRTDVSVSKINHWLEQLTKQRFIVPFVYNNKSYYKIRTFSAHQKIDRPQPGYIPQDEIRRIFDEHSTNEQRTIVDSKSSSISSSRVKGEGVYTNPPPTPEFEGFLEWLKECAPDVLNMPEPLSQEQFELLKQKHGLQSMSRIFQEMHNWPKLTERKSAFITFNQFVKREKAA
jgi:hypothetical protein